MTPQLHPIHPAYQFEAINALRYLGNFLRDRRTPVRGGASLFRSLGLVATGRDIKENFAALAGTIGPYTFTWDGDTLDCSRTSLLGRSHHAEGTFAVDFGDTPCENIEDIWNCPLREVRDSVRAAVARLAAAVEALEPSPEGGIRSRFDALVRRYGLTPRERDILLVALCTEHGLLEYDLGSNPPKGELIRVEELAAYLACPIDEIQPLVQEDSRLRAHDLLDSRLGLPTDTLTHLEGLSRA